jgi:hypothetical protein
MNVLWMDKTKCPKKCEEHESEDFGAMQNEQQIFHSLRSEPNELY